MIITLLCKKRCSVFLFTFFFLLSSPLLYSQIKVFERPTDKDLINTGLFFESDTRRKISLNGEWEISFNAGKSFEKFTVPIAYDFKGNAVFRKRTNIPAEMLESFSFILVAEGIDYESDIKINNNFIISHTGGGTPAIMPLSEGVITTSNELVINVNSALNYKNTTPLSDQINYSKIYGGITKDIYLIAVPKLYIFDCNLKYSIDNLLSVKVTNTLDVRSSNLFKYIDTSLTKEFFIQTKLVRKSTGEEAALSDKTGFTIGDNNSIKPVNEIIISNPFLWTPETPELYDLIVDITNESGELIDEFITETGFTNVTKRSNEIFISGKQIKLNGINYYEDQPKFASALDYTEVEKDLRNIKVLGFNTVRVPGRCAHPYIVNLCNRLGLFLFQEIPFNELSSTYTDNEKYVRQSLNFLSDITVRDKNSPCIIAIGIGNDFDVSSNASLEFVRSAVSLIDSLNEKFTYYTSRSSNEDICSEEVDFVGINFYDNSYEKIKAEIANLTNRTKPVSNRKNPNLFVSYYGLSIENNNSNGFSDIKSQESQMKFLQESYSRISPVMLGNFISSYADWNSENPLNYPLDKNPSLRTNGLYTYNREQKRSTEFVKKMISNEDLPRIQEGNNVAEFPYVFIITGLTVIIILIYFVNKDRKFRSSLIRCMYKPTYFFSLVKDQMIISTGYNLLLAFSISIGLALYFASILFFFRENNSFDMILAKLFSNDSAKLSFSEIVNNKFYLISVLTLLNLLLTFFTAFFLYFISFYTKGKSFFKNIYTVCVWSTLPMLVFLFIGTILYKLTETNPSVIKISMWLFLILYVLYLNRIIMGTKSLFDIRTGKVYLYGIIISVSLFVILYAYLIFFTGALETINLVSNLTS